MARHVWSSVFSGGLLSKDPDYLSGILAQSKCKVCKVDVSYGTLCLKHQKRSERYGSPTAMLCRLCKKIIDDEFTAELQMGRGYRCQSCAPKYCELDTCDKTIKKHMKYCSAAHCKMDEERFAVEEKLLADLANEYGIMEET